MRHYTHLYINEASEVGDVIVLEGINWVVHKKISDTENFLVENGLTKVKFKEELSICENPRKIVLEEGGARLWVNSDNNYDGYVHPQLEIALSGSLLEIYLK